MLDTHYSDYPGGYSIAKRRNAVRGSLLWWIFSRPHTKNIHLDSLKIVQPAAATAAAAAAAAATLPLLLLLLRRLRTPETPPLLRRCAARPLGRPAERRVRRTARPLGGLQGPKAGCGGASAAPALAATHWRQPLAAGAGAGAGGARWPRLCSSGSGGDFESQAGAQGCSKVCGMAA